MSPVFSYSLKGLPSPSCSNRGLAADAVGTSGFFCITMRCPAERDLSIRPAALADWLATADALQLSGFEISQPNPCCCSS